MSAKHKSLGKNYRARKSETTKNNTDDYFPTYHALTKLLLNEIKFNQNDTFLEPCAGAGDITKVIKEFYPNAVIDQCDIKPRANPNYFPDGINQCDFLNKEQFDHVFGCGYDVDHIITNPPFKLFMNFFERCTEIAKKSIIFIAPLDYLHSVERWEKIYNEGMNGFNLDTCYVLVRRPLFDAKWRADGKMPTGSTSFAWFYFKKPCVLRPCIKWIHNNDEMGVPTEADQIMFKDIANIGGVTAQEAADALWEAANANRL